MTTTQTRQAPAPDARRAELTITCDSCHRDALYIAVPANPEADALYSCAHHAYPLAAFTHLPRWTA